MAIQVRRGNEADLIVSNLAAGEPAYCLDTKRLYVGNGDGTKNQVPTMTAVDSEIYSKALVGGTTGGTTSVFTLTLFPSLSAYVVGLMFNVYFHTTIAVGATLNINGLGAKTLRCNDGSALTASVAAGIQTVIYDGTYFRILSVDAIYTATVTLSGNGSSTTLTLRKIGKVVYASDPDWAGYGTSNIQLGTLPVGYRPIGNVATVLTDATGDTALLFRSDGVIVTDSGAALKEGYMVAFSYVVP